MRSDGITGSAIASPTASVADLLPREERVTDLDAWRQENEQRAAARRGAGSPIPAARGPVSEPLPEPVPLVEPVPAVPEVSSPPATPEAPRSPAKPRPPAARPAALGEVPTAVLVTAYLAGDSIDELRRRYRMGWVTVRDRLVAAGVELRPDQGRPRRDLTPDDEIVRAYLAGESLPALAARLHVSKARAARVLEEARVPRRDDRSRLSGGAPKTDPAELVERVRHLYVDEGLSQSAVAREIGSTVKHVQGVMSRNGITSRGPMSPPASAAHAGGNAATLLREAMAAAGVTATEVKAWATAQGMTVAPRGLPRREVLDAYLTAHDPSVVVDHDGEDERVVYTLEEVAAEFGVDLDELAGDEDEADGVTLTYPAEPAEPRLLHLPEPPVLEAPTLGEAVDVAPAGSAAPSLRDICAGVNGGLTGIIPRPARACRECGCTDEAACPEGCMWIEEDLCSACGGPIPFDLCDDVPDDVVDAALAAVHAQERAEREANVERLRALADWLVDIACRLGGPSEDAAAQVADRAVEVVDLLLDQAVAVVGGAA